ncbi:MAG TPA: hypothetical protein VIW03_06570, partial [Anaeromyxobacter sp.]
KVGAILELQALPLSAPYRRATRHASDPAAAALSGGEDYELCVTVPARRVAAALRAAARAGTPLTAVGRITRGAGVRVLEPGGALHAVPPGHDHLAPRPAVLTNARAPIGSGKPQPSVRPKGA